ncbi:AAA family ATPase [Streptomyces ochraceiscleroticus]|uniref:AAA family ATPase n=1 Tax=Streptomyces ochraceiscleroticus TaxID=47761 RepID=A0ABW1MT82_9ACTN|nr:AAA family ATPase [Streptomyces ochraceiscleroticus]
MNKPIRIGVLGTHSTGKTTLLKRIEMELRGHGIPVARTVRLAKRAAAIGLPKMHQHTAASTEWIITQGIADEIAAAAQGAEVILADRAPLDAIAYLHAAIEYRGEHLHQLERERLRLLAATQLPKYDLLLATVLDPDVPVDQSHDYDPHYRQLVDRHVHGLLADDPVPHTRVTSSPASQANVIEQALRLCLQETAA